MSPPVGALLPRTAALLLHNPAASRRSRSGATSSRRRAARQCTGTRGAATRRPTRSSPGQAGRVAERYGVTINHVKLKDTAEAVTRVVAERPRDAPRAAPSTSSGSTARISWRSRRRGLLYGPFTQLLPNFRYVDTTTTRANVVDFTDSRSTASSRRGAARRSCSCTTQRAHARDAEIHGRIAGVGQAESGTRSRTRPCATFSARPS